MPTQPAYGVYELWNGPQCLGAIVQTEGSPSVRLLIDDPSRDAHERLLQAWEQANPKALEETRRRIATLWLHLAAPGVTLQTDSYRASEWARVAWSAAAGSDDPIAKRLALLRILVYSVRGAHERPRSAPAVFSLAPAELHAATRQGTLKWTPLCGVGRGTWCLQPSGLVFLAVFPWENSAVLCTVSGSSFNTALQENIGKLGDLVPPADSVAALNARGEWKVPSADWGARLAAMPKARYGDLLAISPGATYLIEMGRLDAMGAGGSCVHTTWSVLHIATGKRVFEASHEASPSKAAGVKRIDFSGEAEIELTHEGGTTERVALKAPG